MNREAKKKLTRSRLTEAAVTLFERQGYEATTVQMIADAASVAKGTFFNYFSSKEELILELQGLLLAREIESRRGLPGAVLDDLRQSLMDYCHSYPMSPSVTRAVFQGIYGSPNVGRAQAERSKQFRHYLASILELGQQRGEIRADIDAEDLARVAIQTYYGVLMSWALDPETAPLPERMDLAFGLFVRSAGS
ncbi:TetR/AcrR family transcriptional regulator [Cohnella zeiphila]|uniref:TetR/AcrR family transcriptional regulator n=1 Tax=Cohnella zeiphila TaxID=2761120 RepID=A0A7X0SJG5_9BACL|nr:TetR/AcrR family transcriptional regulator [Cohnella zeiphila]MBB6731102.1 TetR/AcrR family transcriptional regulator [Cohnella zeiphila]